MQTLDGGRIGIAAQALGIAEGAMEESINFAKTREPVSYTHLVVRVVRAAHSVLLLPDEEAVLLRLLQILKMCIRDSYILVTGNGNVVFLTVHAERGCGRAGQLTTNQTANGGRIPVSYTHLDVYKRQPQNP